MRSSDAATRNNRSVERDEVNYRARAFGPDAQPMTLHIVNVSAMGLMARCDTPHPPGSRLRISLPVVGVVGAEIRWSLGGRIGCELDRPIELSQYYEMLAALAA